MSEWRRVSRRNPCLVCSKPDWCTLTADGAAAGCMRVESDKLLRNGGWLHRLHDCQVRQRSFTACVPVGRSRSSRNFGQLAKRHERAANDIAVERLAGKLGVSAGALRRLHIGWDGSAWTFPMRNAIGEIIGIRRRLPDGRKLSVRGGREGLFIPNGLAGAGPLLVCEGATDTAALLTLGFDAVGRPSCQGGVLLLRDYCKGCEVTVFADGDEPGCVGAWKLARTLRLYCPLVKVIRPPGVIKDARQWLQRGGTSAELEQHIAAAKPLQLGIETSRRPT